MNIKDEQIIIAFKSENEKIMRQCYQNWQEPFKAFLQKTFGLDADKVGEIFNDSYTALYLNIKKGKLNQPMQSGLKTYLFAVGKNLALKTFRKTKVTLTENIPESGEAPDVERSIHYIEQQHKVATILAKIGEPCRSVLRLFYIEEKDYNLIAKELGMGSNTNSLRKKKFDCIKKMKKLFQ